jgi:hypothetical protein
MLHDSRRARRLFLLAAIWLSPVTGLAQSPTLTTVSDTVFRADGSPASGTLLISWPAFTTSEGHAVVAGTKSVTLSSAGAFSVQLAPNVGSTPAGITYTVVYQLSDSTVKTEYWAVGTTSPQTVGQVRTVLGTGTPAGQLATQQYVNAALANVVHLSGNETITGTKQFAVAPSFPSPTQAGQAANKAYVDASVAGGGGGGSNFVLKSGDSMTGALSLPANPTSPMQASTKQYVDLSGANKADLINGMVPANELGSGIANTESCLHGDSTWGGCGSGSGGGVTPGMQSIKYATDFNWSQGNSADLSSAGAKTLTLSSCPAGVTGSEPQYYIYISGTGTAEAVNITGGTCAGDGQSGSLQFTTANSHAAGYTLSSASGGLQEALIAARFTPANPTGSSQSGNVIVPPGELKAYAKVSIRASNITVDFSGSIIECWMNTACIFVGDPASSTLFQDITLMNPRGRPTVSGGLQPFIEVRYRGYGRAMARVTNAASIAAEQHGVDDGIRGVIRHLKSPPARTSVDCENGALAIVTDGPVPGYAGSYRTWSDFLPGGANDVFPGDGLEVDLPSRAVAFRAIVNEVVVNVKDLAGDHCEYQISFLDATSEMLSFEFESARSTAALNVPPITTAQVGATTLADLTSAAITQVSSTTASLDAGVTPPSGGGIEVRWTDIGWGPNNDQNLAGRFTTQSFTLPRLGKTQDYYLRQYDGSNPRRYSRYSAALHLDYPY